MEKVLSQEAIGFQDPKFFKELAQAVREMRGMNFGVSAEDFRNLPGIRKIAAMIKERMGLTVVPIVEETPNGDFGPSIELPALNRNHIFFQKYLNDNIYEERDLHRLFHHFENRKLKAWVDLKTAKVGGAFSVLPFLLWLPRDFFQLDTHTPEGVAAIILHELGHAFTQLEFLNRTMTTNESLRALAAARQNPEFEAKKEFVLARLQSYAHLSDDDLKLIAASRDATSDAIVIAGAAHRWALSELGESVYDSAGCEYLADQFAARFGASRDLVIILDQREKRYRESEHGGLFGSVVRVMVTLVIGVPLVVLTAGGIIPLVLLSMTQAQTRVQTHEQPFARFTRLRHQNTERLKNRNLNKEAREALLADNELIERILKDYNDNLGFFEKLAYITRPAYRKARKNEMWQKELEALGHNKLFDHAAAFAK